MTSLDLGHGVRTALTRLREFWEWYDAIPPIRKIHAVLGRVGDGWRRMSRWLNGIMPKGLYARALLIIIAPMVILQSVVAFVFMERHWNLVTQRLSAGVVSDIAALIDVYNTYPQDADRAQIRRIAQQRLGLVVDFLPLGDLPPPGPKPFFSLLDQSLSEELRKQIARPFWIDTVGKSALVEIRVQLDNAVMRVFARRSAAYASNSEIFLLWMVGTSTVLLTVAIIFLRNQIKPILKLADAAESFGKGRDVPNFKPRGARDGAAHRDACRRVARPAHGAHALQARTRAHRRFAGSRSNEEGHRRDGTYAGGLPGLRARRSRRAAGLDRHGGVSRRAQARRRASRPQGERRVSRTADRHGATGGVQALPCQSRVERGALCALDRDHGPPRSSLPDRHRGR